MPTKKRDNKANVFDWSLGKGVSSLPGAKNADYSLFIFDEDAYGSTGRKVFQVLALLGPGIAVQSGEHAGYEGLVDLRTGNLLWLNATPRSGNVALCKAEISGRKDRRTRGGLGGNLMFGSKMRVILRARSIGLPILVLGILSACGGADGGGDAGGGPSNPDPIANQPPVFSSVTTTSVVENASAAIYQAAASDPNGDALTYSITGGPDAARFTISAAGQLSFVAAPNYDLPDDADGNNVYQVQIGASDGRASTGLALSVTVTNSKEGIAVHRVATGFTNPVAIAPVSETAMLVAEKSGAVYLLNTQTGTKSLLVQIANVGTVGVTALVAAPTFAANGTFFAMYTTQNGYLVINRFLRNPAGPTVPDNYGPLLGVNAPQYAGGGWLGYDASGILLAATGDAGGSADNTGSAQDAASRLGKLLRIAPNPIPMPAQRRRFS